MIGVILISKLKSKPYKKSKAYNYRQHYYALDMVPSNSNVLSFRKSS